jgi:phospholipid/cholesterol/gamma-HCH transport system substrate-binding protein
LKEGIMKKIDLELTVGIFVLIGILCLAYLSIKIAKEELGGGKGYEIYAIFSNIGGLKEGASAVIAGVEVGQVTSISMEDYEAKVVIRLPFEVKIQEDAIAAIKTKGLIGEKYVMITPGGADEMVPPGGRIRETLPALDVEELISNFVFGKV